MAMSHWVRPKLRLFSWSWHAQSNKPQPIDVICVFNEACATATRASAACTASEVAAAANDAVKDNPADADADTRAVARAVAAVSTNAASF